MKPHRIICCLGLAALSTLGLLRYLSSKGAPLHVSQIAADLEDATSSAKDYRLSGLASFQILGEHGAEIAWRSDAPAAHRARVVELAPSLLQPSEGLFYVGQNIELNDVDGNTIRAKITDARVWSGGTHAVRASIVGDPDGFLVLSAVGGVARALAKDGRTGRITQIRFDAERGVHVLLDVDYAGSSRLACGHEDDLHGLGAHPFEALETDAPDGSASSSSGSWIESDPVSGPQADVLVLYTPAALDIEGSEANMRVNASQSLLLGNQVLEDSGVPLRLNLVEVQPIDFVESSSASSDLTDLTEFDNDTDQVHDLRDYYAADFVVTFANMSRAGGVGWRLPGYDNADRAFSLVRVQQSDTTSYTTIHELGHNMGNGHSKTQRVTPYNSNFVPYAAGWQWADSSSSASVGYCSVMTYENFNSSGGDEYVRVGHFSNPEINYQGVPTGHVVDGDAARVIREGSLYYVDYRESSPLLVYSNFPYESGFDDADSVLRQSIDDDHRWTTGHSGATPSADTGPSSAHAGSAYAYVEASGNNNREAALEGAFDFSELEAPQLDFYYHMRDASGFSMGHLEVEVSIDEGVNWQPIWEVAGEQGDQWHLATVPLEAFAGEPLVWLRFLATTGSGYRSDIALDSIELFETAEPDPVTGFDQWLSSDYPGLSDPSPEGDPDGDGLMNFLEYAFAANPDLYDPGSMPTTRFDAVERRLTFEFRRGQESLRYALRSTDEVGSWVGATTEWDSLTASDLVEVGEWQTVEVDASGAQLFLRLEVFE